MNSNIYIHDTDSIHHLKEAIRTFSEEICGNRQLLSFRLQDRISTLVIRQKSLYAIQDSIEVELRDAKEDYENCLNNSCIYEDEDEDKSRKTKRDGCEKRNAFIETKTKCASNLIRKVTAYLQNQSKTPSLYIKINGIQMDF